MATRKTPATKKTASNRPNGAAKPGQRPGRAAGQSPGARKPAKGKSIVNQKQTPWGMIAAAVAVVVFAAVVVSVVVATHKSSSDRIAEADKNYHEPALAAAMAIKGVVHKTEGDHTHVFTTVKYDTNPPTGGNHAQIWAQCTGVVYDHQLANENAVHSMEHGGVWVTYNADKLSKTQVATLAKDVNGVDRAFMTPYAGLKTAVSLQAWGYQLFVNSPTDPRVEQFIKLFTTSTNNWPERGATCSDPVFDANSSKPGSPQFQQAT